MGGISTCIGCKLSYQPTVKDFHSIDFQASGPHCRKFPPSQLKYFSMMQLRFGILSASSTPQCTCSANIWSNGTVSLIPLRSRGKHNYVQKAYNFLQAVHSFLGCKWICPHQTLSLKSCKQSIVFCTQQETQTPGLGLHEGSFEDMDTF